MKDQDEDADSSTEGNQLDFSSLIQPALEDAQTRLVFRTQAILREDIEHYKPKLEDLENPSRNRSAPLSGRKEKTVALSGRRSTGADHDQDQVANAKNVPETLTTPIPKTPIIVDQDDDYEDSTEMKLGLDANGRDDWYPTLKKAIWLLSRIYRLVHVS
jgi:hypothetical protein